MHTRTSLFSLLLLTLAVSASAQVLPTGPQAQPARPLNLALPRYAAQETNSAAVAVDADAVAARLAQPAAHGSKAQGGAAQLPYGAGFERRQQGNASGGSGRGGMGRGR